MLSVFDFISISEVIGIVAAKSHPVVSVDGLSIESCKAYFSGNLKSANNCRYGEVPTQVAMWLFLLAIIGFIGFLNRKKL